MLTVDLHCHSHFSDGTFSPAELIEKALLAQVNLLALTDHDTTVGLPLLRTAAEATGIRIINGVELSVRWKLHEIHILGLNIDICTASFTQLLTRQQDSRLVRAKAMATLLEPVGIDDGYQKACDLAGHPNIGRPHLAQLLVNAGKSPDIQSAFKRYLGKGKLAYVPTPWIQVEEAVNEILRAGGIPILAHPMKYSLTRTKRHALFSAFKEAGGIAIEVISGETKQSELTCLLEDCQRFDFFASSGSDFHGEKSIVKLGRQRSLPTAFRPVWELF